MQLHVLRNCKHHRNIATNSVPPPFTATFCYMSKLPQCCVMYFANSLSQFCRKLQGHWPDRLVHHHHLWHHFQTVEFRKVRISTKCQQICVLHSQFTKRQYQKIGKIVTLVCLNSHICQISQSICKLSSFIICFIMYKYKGHCWVTELQRKLLLTVFYLNHPPFH